MHAGTDWRDARGQERVDRFPDGHAGERAELEGMLVDLKARGLSIAPEVAVGDGALGFWKALDETFPSTRHHAAGCTRR